eukprot:490900-Ditylum_brightwellii.AAC.1
MPFTIPPLSVEVDWVSNSITLELVLKGEYSNSKLSYLQALLLTHCKSEQTKAAVGESIDLGKWKDKSKSDKKERLCHHLESIWVTVKQYWPEIQTIQNQKRVEHSAGYLPHLSAPINSTRSM